MGCRANGAGAHRLSPAGADVSEFAWVPGGGGRGEGGVLGGQHRLLLLGHFRGSAGSTKHREFGAYSDLIGFSVAPSGRALAVSYRQGPSPAPGKSPTWKGVLSVVPLSGVPQRVVYTLPEGGYVDLRPGWWPDGKGLLFWDDPAGSASIGADGLALDSLDLATGRLATLATTLTYNNWVSWSPNGTTVAIVAGGNRIIWDSAKHLVLCAMPAAHCHSVPPPSTNLMSLDPTWTASGSLVYDLARDRVPERPLAARPGPRRQRPLYATQRRDLVRANGAVRSKSLGAGGHPMAGAPAGAHDPLALPEGLLFSTRCGLVVPARRHRLGGAGRRRLGQPQPVRQLLRLHRLVPGLRLARLSSPRPGVPTPAHRVVEAVDAQRRYVPDVPGDVEVSCQDNNDGAVLWWGEPGQQQ